MVAELHEDSGYHVKKKKTQIENQKTRCLISDYILTDCSFLFAAFASSDKSTLLQREKKLSSKPPNILILQNKYNAYFTYMDLFQRTAGINES